MTLTPQPIATLEENIPFPSSPADNGNKRYAKTLRLTSDQLVRGGF